jgi:purine-binding chemotaxis protein CheW
MADGTSPLAAEASSTFDTGALVFALAGERYAVRAGAVEGIAMPPSLCRVPHATPGLLGAGNLGGQVLPIIDFAALVRGGAVARPYDGSGAILRLRAAGGHVGLWIDRVERLIASAAELTATVSAIDPEPLIRLGMTAPGLGEDARHPLGDVREIAALPTPVRETAFFVVEAAGERVRLPHDAVLEFVEPPPSVVLPGAPAGFLGVGILRGAALPMVSLAALIGASEAGSVAMFAVIGLANGHRVLLGCSRIVGLRSGEDGRLVDPRAALPKNLRLIVTGFAIAETEPTDTTDAIDAAPYFAFAVGRQSYALPVWAVERVVEPQRLMTLPRRPGMPQAITAAIELRGQAVPLARLAAGDPSANETPGLYVILRGEAGLIALGARRFERFVALRPQQITPPPDGEGPIDGVALLEGGDLLQILAPDRIGSAS